MNLILPGQNIVAQLSSPGYVSYDVSSDGLAVGKIDINNLRQGKLVQQFYSENKVVWHSTISDSIKRNKLANLITNADWYALNPDCYHEKFLTARKVLKNIEDTVNAELIYTDAALSFMHDLAYGGDYNFVQYNAIKYHPDNLDLISALRTALTSIDLIENITKVEPSNDKYNALKQEYVRMLGMYKEQDLKDVTVTSKQVVASNLNLVIKLRQLGYLANTDTTDQNLKAAFKKFQQQYSLLVQPSMTESSLAILNETISHKLEALIWNLAWYRWLNLMKDKQFIAINIPANHLTFFDKSSVKLESRMVVGKTSTPTPTLISEIKNVIYYPYWNIPRSIATKEILPILKRAPGYLQELKLEVLLNGNVINGSGINWHSYSVSNFPFQLRQKPGCQNALGRLKFDFDNPYHVYIHDTNVKFAFLAKKRFLSHGCMRIEKPFELAVALGVPPEKIDMTDCLENKKPEIIALPKAVPVFVIYATIYVQNGQLQWYEDAYHKIRKLK
jgi:murein L,D-transpeptidase YcbB/YkuD